MDVCVDATVQAETVHCYSKNKPWVTANINVILKVKKRTFRAGNKEQVAIIQGGTEGEDQGGKRQVQEWKLQTTSMKEV